MTDKLELLIKIDTKLLFRFSYAKYERKFKTFIYLRLITTVSQVKKGRILTCVNFPFTILRLSNESFKLFKLLSFNDWIFELENCKCFMSIDDVENKSFPNVITVRSKSYIDKDWIGECIFCRLLRNSTLVIPGHSRKRPVNNKKNID